MSKLSESSVTKTTTAEDPTKTASGAKKLLGPIGFIGTGGTIASIAIDEFDFLDYNAKNDRVEAEELFEKTGLYKILQGENPVLFSSFKAIDSTEIEPENWLTIAKECQLFADQGVRGIVIGHGTASLEETAWVLSLVLDLKIPVVLTGSMRPLNGVSSDAGANLLAAFRVASHDFTEKPGVLVVINDEIHYPRMVTKTHTLRVGAFQSPWHGPIGHVDGDEVNITSKRLKSRVLPSAPDLLQFAPELLGNLPRVDIVYSYIGADAIMVEACVNAGAKGIVSAGFGPGLGSPAERDAFEAAIKGRSVTVVQSSRLGAGLVVDSQDHKSRGIIAGNDLNPQKARILLALCLAKGYLSEEIEEVFRAI
ncbi:hypothetical protein CkaCkLH20_04376 [Colletotrichum karsti]|uniref:asparaginase n=1 Tax=Colletotrichum karsti TaxID=1095194 RepID=A0A9P6LM02_9PEZI|nr:uncharacterized protein CkaCkLH20_04376 [Colletotrichum karsti]KAF9878338.1 hypothetical protein CkaCkLH20_04376 [Colletotrichum karsti]